MARALRVCATSGCPAFTDAGYCSRCRQERQARQLERRGNSAQQGYGARWRRLRAIILARDPICRICNQAPSTEVDHIEPKAPDQDAADATEDELQGTCKPCHSTKTLNEQRMACRPRGVENFITRRELSPPGHDFDVYENGIGRFGGART